MELMLPVLPTKPCNNCSFAFETLNSRERYCCGWCRQQARNHRQKHKVKYSLENWNEAARLNHNHIIQRFARKEPRPVTMIT